MEGEKERKLTTSDLQELKSHHLHVTACKYPPHSPPTQHITHTHVHVHVHMNMYMHVHVQCIYMYMYT